MASETILNNEIARLGQSQEDRSPPALDPLFVPVDARLPVDRLAEARRLAEKLRFYGFDPQREDGNWQGFFPENAAELLARDDGSVPPHLGLFGAFLQQLEPARGALNELAGKHLDFQYRRVLGFEALGAQPEHAHLSLGLKKAAAPFAVTPSHRFSGGKDAAGLERLYQPLRETLVGQGAVAALHSIYRDASGLHFAPIANSADGLGTPLDPARPLWSAFGHASLAKAPVGFALAAPVLRMREGVRQLSIELNLSFIDTALDGESLADVLHAYVSGDKGWLGPYSLSGHLEDGKLVLDFSIAASEAPVVDYDAALHGGAFAAAAPIVQILIRPEAAANYTALATLRVDKAVVRVKVSGVRTLSLENDHGALNPKKTFQPFGPQPVKGSRFLIGCEEALSKQLSDLQVALRWQGAPSDLAAWYVDYPSVKLMQKGVSARLLYADRSGNTTSRELDLMPRSDGVTLSPNSPPASADAPVSPGGFLRSMMTGGSVFSRLFGARYIKQQPVFLRDKLPPPALRSGYVTVALVDDFLHAEYRKETIRLAKIPGNTTVLNEPWTPSVQEISLSYAAASPVLDLGLSDEAAFAAGHELQFFHVGPFGQRREHAFLRRQFDWVAEKSVSLLPAFPDEGEFIIGTSGLAAGESISLLLQVAEGSADPELPAQAVRWSVLCDNYWRPVADDELALDTTRGLRASGLVGIVLGRNTTTENTWLPPGRVWLKAGVAANSAAACRLLAVAANGLEVVRVWPADAIAPHVETLPAGSIGKLLAPPPALKQVLQPYPTFGGRAAESEAMRNRRAAERLRHRQRCITPWDYERLLLESFPSVHRIKCIPHASEKSWMAPGNVLIVAIPDLRNQNAPDLLQPRVDLDTLTRMTETAQRHAGPQVSIRVRNAHYVPIRLDFKVRFRAGQAFNYLRQQLHEALVRALSPWAFASDVPLQFGGRLYRSVLLDFVEELPYVDYVTDFRCGLAGPGTLLLNDVAEITVDRPDAILVSADRHLIAEAP